MTKEPTYGKNCIKRLVDFKNDISEQPANKYGFSPIAAKSENNKWGVFMKDPLANLINIDYICMPTGMFKEKTYYIVFKK